MARESVGQVAVQLKQQCQEVVAVLAFSQVAGRCRLLIQPRLCNRFSICSVSLSTPGCGKVEHTGWPPNWLVVSSATSLVA